MLTPFIAPLLSPPVQVEARVKAALAKKDETVSGLRDQVAALTRQLQATEEVLAQQQQELGGY